MWQWQGRGGPIRHVVTPNIPSSPIVSIIPKWSLLLMTIIRRRHIESSVDCHGIMPGCLHNGSDYKQCVLWPGWVTISISIMAILLIWWISIFVFTARNCSTEDCNGNECKLKLINNALKCNLLKPFVQLIKFSNLNEKIQLLKCFLLESTSGKTLYSISFNNIKGLSYSWHFNEDHQYSRMGSPLMRCLEQNSKEGASTNRAAELRKRHSVSDV